MRILIVDDDRINRRVLSAMLDIEGVDLVEADSGENALCLAQQGVFDIVLMDLRMPAMDGLETTRRIRGQASPNAHAPIAIVTADASTDLRAECLAVGADELIRKPVRLDELHDVMGRLLVERRPSQAAKAA